MLDRIVIKNKYEAVMVFTDRPPFYLSSDKNVMDIVKIMLEPMKEVETKNLIGDMEDTVRIAA